MYFQRRCQILIHYNLKWNLLRYVVPDDVENMCGSGDLLEQILKDCEDARC
jgi:hypothetical protein